MTIRINANGSYASLLWLLSFLFAARVIGQAVQRCTPQLFLPPIAAFQGSNLPYGLLLPVQLAILALMAFVSWRVQNGMLAPSLRAGNVLAWLGGIYMAGALARIVVGLAAPGAPEWFRTWIPALFHVVLAGFVLTLAVYHRHRFRAVHGEARK